MKLSQQILVLADAYRRHTGRAPTTVSKKLTGDSKLVGLLSTAEGAGRITERRAEEIIAGIFDKWPSDLAWPSEVTRPAPQTNDSVPQLLNGGKENAVNIPLGLEA
jgi:hypothetical protein